MTIPLGILGSAKVASGGGLPSDRLVRNAQVYQTSGSSRTVTFSEGTALDNTYLLVAVVTLSSTSAPTTPTGWSVIASLAASNRGIHVYAKQGDSSVNSITVSGGGSVAAHTLLMGFAGYTSLTPKFASAEGTSVSGATSVSLADPGVSGDYGVALVGVTTALDSGGFGSWTGGFSMVGTASARGAIGRTEYTGSGTYATSITWTTTRTNTYFRVIMPLVAP